MRTRPRSDSNPRTPAPRAGVAAREAATGLLAGVLDRREPLDRLLDHDGGDIAYNALPPRDRRLAHAIVATALRRHGQIDAIVSRLVERWPRKAGALRRIIETTAAQILFMDVPDHAAVSTALEQVGGDRDARHFKGLANAVLRRIARDRDVLLGDPALPATNTPDWLQLRWVAAYGEDAAAGIMASHLVEPGLDLTVKAEPELWAERLGGIVLPTGSVRLVPSGPVEDLPGFAEGAWWVQDAAAALPAKLLGNVSGLRVADLCAAPGGKTAALAAAGAKVTAVDVSAARLARLTANLARLGLAAEIIAADVLAFQPDTPFDAVLLDAPCTATGTIRRHPDIAWLKREGDIAPLAKLQSAMLDRAVAMLKPGGGTLIYCTCSLEPEEGEAQAARAIDRHRLEPLPVEPPEVGGLSAIVTSAAAVRTLPSCLPNDVPRLSGMDGFFILRARKP